MVRVHPAVPINSMCWDARPGLSDHFGHALLHLRKTTADTAAVGLGSSRLEVVAQKGFPPAHAIAVIPLKTVLARPVAGLGQHERLREDGREMQAVRRRLVAHAAFDSVERQRLTRRAPPGNTQPSTLLDLELRRQQRELIEANSQPDVGGAEN